MSKGGWDVAKRRRMTSGWPLSPFYQDMTLFPSLFLPFSSFPLQFCFLSPVSVHNFCSFCSLIWIQCSQKKRTATFETKNFDHFLSENFLLKIPTSPFLEIDLRIYSCDITFVHTSTHPRRIRYQNIWFCSFALQEEKLQGKSFFPPSCRAQDGYFLWPANRNVDVYVNLIFPEMLQISRFLGLGLRLNLVWRQL